MSESYKGRTINAANDPSWTAREITVLKQLIDDQFMWEEKITYDDLSGTKALNLATSFIRRVQWIPAGGVANGDLTVTLSNPTDGQVLFVANYDTCGCALTIGGIQFLAPGCGYSKGLIIYDNGAWRLMSAQTD